MWKSGQDDFHIIFKSKIIGHQVHFFKSLVHKYSVCVTVHGFTDSPSCGCLRMCVSICVGVTLWSVSAVSCFSVLFNVCANMSCLSDHCMLSCCVFAPILCVFTDFGFSGLFICCPVFWAGLFLGLWYPLQPCVTQPTTFGFTPAFVLLFIVLWTSVNKPVLTRIWIVCTSLSLMLTVWPYFSFFFFINYA